MYTNNIYSLKGHTKGNIYDIAGNTVHIQRGEAGNGKNRPACQFQVQHTGRQVVKGVRNLNTRGRSFMTIMGCLLNIIKIKFHYF